MTRMKYLAILKDCFREAVDTKVFYVMVGLSLLVTLVAATLSFKPRSPEKIMQFMALPLFGELNDLNPERIMHMVHDPTLKAYKVVGAAPLDNRPEGPDSPYSVTILAHCQSDAEAAKLRQFPSQVQELIKQRFGTIPEPDSGEKFQMVEVTDVRLALPGNRFVPEKTEAHDVYFEIQTRPTSVTRRLWPHEPSLFFGALPLTFLGELPLGVQLWLLLDQVVNGLGAWIAILVSVIITAFFIPNMLRKGTVDLLLVKPIHRTTLLLYKYAGGLLFILLNTALVVVGLWLVIGLRSGIWVSSFLLTVLVITFFFAILYAASTLFGVLTRSPIAAILLTCAVWFVLYIAGILYQLGEGFRKQEERSRAAAARRLEQGDPKELADAEAVNRADEKDRRGRSRGLDDPPPVNPNNLFFTAVRGVHYVLPRTKDLDHLMSRLLIRDLLTANQVKEQKIDDTRISWQESLTVSGIFIGLMLGLSCLRFATKDY
jgi:ABC-type transport system involved in multi-copper enzyme maturation permease subunit